jgi:hypothetical protein
LSNFTFCIETPGGFEMISAVQYFSMNLVNCRAGRTVARVAAQIALIIEDDPPVIATLPVAARAAAVALNAQRSLGSYRPIRTTSLSFEHCYGAYSTVAHPLLGIEN